MRDLLPLAVIEQVEIRALQIARQLALFVRDDDIYLNQFGLYPKQRLVLFLLLLRISKISTASGTDCLHGLKLRPSRTDRAQD
jgi:hypothetical protein